MAIRADDVAVGTTATVIVTAAVAAKVIVGHRGGAPSVFLGDSTVTSAPANGFELKQNADVTIELQKGESLYGIVAAATEAVHFLISE